MKSAPPSHTRTSTFSHIAGLFAIAGQYLTARLSLAGMEAKDAGSQYGIAAGMLVGGLFVAILGYVFLIFTAVFGIAAASEWKHAWIVTMGGAALLHLGGATVLGILARRRLRAGAFSQTLEEIKKDQAWLKNLTNNR